MVISRLRLIFILFGVITFVSGCNTGFGRSSNNDLESLTVVANNSTQALTPSFSSDETRYRRTVGFSVASVSIEAEADHELATMTLQGTRLENNVARNINLSVGENTVRIEVTAENERKKTYTIVITRDTVDSSDADLSSLEIIGGSLGATFSSNDTSYNLPKTVLQGSIGLLLDFDDQATAHVDGNVIPRGEVSEVVINGRQSNIEIVVTAGDGTENTYTLVLPVGNSATSGVVLRNADADDNDDVGFAVALSERFLALGAPEDDAANEIDPENNENLTDSGAVYIFQRQDENSNWQDGNDSDSLPDFVVIKARNDNTTPVPILEARFGASLAIDENTLAVGAPGSGDVYVYEYNASTSSWDWIARINDPNDATDSEFGYSLGLTGNLLVIGSPGQNKVFVYEFTNNDEWELAAEYDPQNVGESDVEFGKSVAVNFNQSEREFVVGSPGENSERGAVYYYEKSANWPQSGEKYTASNGRAGDKFGSAVSLNDDVLVVGAPEEDFNLYGVALVPEDDTDHVLNSARGAVYLFDRSDDPVWTENDYYLKPPGIYDNGNLVSGSDNAKNFGLTLVSKLGSIVVGYSEEDSGEIVTATTDTFFASPSVERNNNDSGTQLNSGAVLLYSKTTATPGWVYSGLFKANAPETSEQFGIAVDLYDGQIAVGAYKENGVESGSGQPKGAGYVIK